MHLGDKVACAPGRRGKRNVEGKSDAGRGTHGKSIIAAGLCGNMNPDVTITEMTQFFKGSPHMVDS